MRRVMKGVLPFGALRTYTDLLPIRAMPTFLIFRDGERADEIVGANPIKLEEKIRKYVE